MPTCNGKPATITAEPGGGTTGGTFGDDVIIGTEGQDLIIR
ncbi:hypothetical protein [Streptomyces sp. 6N223]